MADAYLVGWGLPEERVTCGVVAVRADSPGEAMKRFRAILTEWATAYICREQRYADRQTLLEEVCPEGPHRMSLQSIARYYHVEPEELQRGLDEDGVFFLVLK
jgi:hypothetical protein